MVQTSLHAQIGAVNHHNLKAANMNGRVGIDAKNGPGHQTLGLSSGFSSNNHHNNLTSLNSQHHGGIIIDNGISASNYNTSNHHQNHHLLGHNSNRNRHLSAAAAASLNSHFTHSHFNSNLSQNSHHHHHHHHHHQLSLSSSSSAMSSASSASSSPSASISPSSIAPGSPPQSNLGISGLHQTGSSFHNSANHLIENVHHPSNSSQQQQQQQQPQQQNTSRYKTELCRPFEENGTCKYGEKCQFAHGLSELRTLTRHPKYKTEFCRTFHTTGFCPYGPRCHFIHNSKTPPTQAQLGISPYSKLPFGHQTSHSASPSTSPISSTSSATTTNGSLCSADSTSSSSPPSSSRLLDATSSGFSYRTIGATNGGSHSNVSERHAIIKTAVRSGLRGDEDGDISQSSVCASDSQRLFWLHSHMNEGSRWPPAMCASGLIGSNNSRRTWQLQA